MIPICKIVYAEACYIDYEQLRSWCLANFWEQIIAHFRSTRLYLLRILNNLHIIVIYISCNILLCCDKQYCIVANLLVTHPLIYWKCNPLLHAHLVVVDGQSNCMWNVWIVWLCLIRPFQNLYVGDLTTATSGDDYNFYKVCLMLLMWCCHGNGTGRRSYMDYNR